MSKTSDPSSISFTAMYTGYVWYKNGLAPKFLTTAPGSFFYLSLFLPEMFGKWLIGGNIKTFLLQRHIIIDELVRRAIEEEGYTQVIEIACGLSPRGHQFMQKYRDKGLVYIEADLPGMAHRKRNLLQGNNCLDDQHKVIECNILDDGENSLENVFSRELDSSRKTLVLTEGLVNYFPLPLISSLWSRINTALKAFPEGKYITDVYPAIDTDPLFIVRKWMQKALALITRSDFTLHFNNDEEAHSCFKDCGFDEVSVIDPQQQYGKLPIPEARRRSLVRVIQSTSKSS